MKKEPAVKKTGAKVIRASLAGVFILFLSGCSLLNFSNLFGGPRGDEYVLEETDEIRDFLSRVRPWPGNPRSHYLLGCNYLRAGRSDEAIREFRKTILIEPLSAEAYNGIGMAHDQKGEYDRAVVFYRTALRINPDLPFIHNNLGYSYMLQGKYELAIESFNKALALNLKDSPARNNSTVRNNIGLAYALMGRSDIIRQETKAPAAAGENAAGITEQTIDVKNSNPAVDEALQGLAAAASLREIVRPQKTEPQSAQSSKPNIVKSFNPGIGIEVSNGNGVNRMARNVSMFLGGRGFKVGRLTNAPAFNFKETKVYYRSGYGGLASRLSEALPGTQRADESRGFDRPQIKIKIVLGKDLIPYKSVLDKGLGGAKS